MYFSLDVLPAHKGDCLMLHYGSESDRHLMLIDGGPADVYKLQLKPRIKRVHASRQLDETDALPVDVVMVSHIDDDHIRGLLELTKEQRGKSPDLRLRVRSLWHNSFDEILSGEAQEAVPASGAASVLAGLDQGPAAFGGELEDGNEETHQAIELLSSIPQGRQLREDAEALRWGINRQFKGRLISATEASKPVTLDGGLKVTVAGPMQRELSSLRQAHEKWLREHAKGRRKTPEAMLAAFVDKSVPNLSSIVVLAELGGKTMLLTGDARGDRILEGLKLARVLKPGGKLHVNILKVPHHGSSNNMETGFFRRVTADHYVFSGDGQHGNPRRETLEMLLEARGHDDDYAIHLTYPLKTIDTAREADWNKEQAKEKKRFKKNPVSKNKPRSNWSPAKHSLAALLKIHPELKKKLRIVKGEHLHLIDLLDPVKL